MPLVTENADGEIEYLPTPKGGVKPMKAISLWQPLTRYSEVYVESVTGEKYTVGVDGENQVYIKRREEYSGLPLPEDIRLCRKAQLPRADWSQAPAEAQWWSVDASGFAYWYEDEPERDQEDHFWSGINPIYAGDIDIPLGIDWRLLKERRPEPAP